MTFFGETAGAVSGCKDRRALLDEWLQRHPLDAWSPPQPEVVIAHLLAAILEELERA